MIPEEILKQKVFFRLDGSISNVEYKNVIKAMEEYGQQEFNRAIELAAENAKTERVFCDLKNTRCSCRTTIDCDSNIIQLDKDSILNLKIK